MHTECSHVTMHIMAAPQIAKYSLVRAAERICVAKRKREDADGELRAAEAAVALAKTLTQQVSEVGDDRYAQPHPWDVATAYSTASTCTPVLPTTTVSAGHQVASMASHPSTYPHVPWLLCALLHCDTPPTDTGP